MIDIYRNGLRRNVRLMNMKNHAVKPIPNV